MAKPCSMSFIQKDYYFQYVTNTHECSIICLSICNVPFFQKKNQTRYLFNITCHLLSVILFLFVSQFIFFQEFSTGWISKFSQQDKLRDFLRTLKIASLMSTDTRCKSIKLSHSTCLHDKNIWLCYKVSQNLTCLQFVSSTHSFLKKKRIC